MAVITAAMVKELREATAAGILDCRTALEIAEGDFDKAVDCLREKGLAQAAKRMSREAKDGLVVAYVHPGGRIGVLVEVNCETDFVARTDEFKTLANNIAMQIAAMSPRYVRREDIPEAVLAHEREVFRAQALEEGKPAQVVDRIVEGRLEKFCQEVCLLEQTFIRDEERTVDDIIKDVITRTGENVIVRRFARFELGESLEA
ncbi:MAG: translation elongation factor Ts [Chloroflexi bacterium]|nr:translation elongation factor Ts [Chloroflexota bacterium]OQA95785.1 MAG: Elongation factor Ts [Chloroflexi bacterium ADurb.Bin222]HOC20380.1 translation elongation factor Ts [Anaerolineae bacterium]HOS80466.1 translation elongation factor Ts [Anaerolineae bacterium]HQE99499.1 translation elongation factor Ts [Anaerolineae bacterium]